MYAPEAVFLSFFTYDTYALRPCSLSNILFMRVECVPAVVIRTKRFLDMPSICCVVGKHVNACNESFHEGLSTADLQQFFLLERSFMIRALPPSAAEDRI